MSEKAFEVWAAGVVYNDQPLTERGGIPYFLAEKAWMAGMTEGQKLTPEDRANAWDEGRAAAYEEWKRDPRGLYYFAKNPYREDNS